MHPAFPEILRWLPLGVALGLALCGMILRWRRRRPRVNPNQQAKLDALRDGRRDPLTGLASRQSFLGSLAARLASGAPSALLLLDLDGFAETNATHGHRAGDEVLAAIADRLRTVIPAGAVLGRLGADEFGVLMEARAGESVVEAASLRLLRALTAPLVAGLRKLDCKISLAAAISSAHGAEPDALMRSALAELALIKQEGGGAWRIYDPERHAARAARIALGDELETAAATGGILPYYLPIVDLGTGAIAGLEVLARWAHPRLGLLQPSAFILLAEERQLAGRITAALMRRVIGDSREWPPHLYFAFNTSPGQLRELIALLRDPPGWPEGRMDPARIEVEITGSAVIEDIAVAREVISLLQAQGTRVVLDDFGTGTPNFLHMRELCFDRLKIDRSFVIGLEENERARFCLRAMAGLSHSLGVTLTAEGIETEAARTFLAELGCRYGQGFLFSEAIPAKAVMKLLCRAAPAGEALVACRA